MPTTDLATVVAACRGDSGAVAALAAGYLPLVYNIVGRAMNGHPDVDDVVQETMLRAVRGIGELRDPAAFRAWLVAIAIRQVRDSFRDRLARPPAVESDAPVPDFADQAIERLGLSGQRLQAMEATRWLDDDDRPVLALWWQEAAGRVTRAELAAGLGLTSAHAAVRVGRMKERLVTSRMVVHALRRRPRCGSLTAITAGWDEAPSPLWRKRLARHVRDCTWCLTDAGDMIPAERLLGGLPLLAVPAGAGHVGRYLRPFLARRRTGRCRPGRRARQPASAGTAACGGRQRFPRPRPACPGAVAGRRAVRCRPSWSRYRSRCWPARPAGRSRSPTRGAAGPAAPPRPAVSATALPLAARPVPLVTQSARVRQSPAKPSRPRRR